MSHQNWKPSVLTKNEKHTDKDLKKNAINDGSSQGFAKAPKSNLDGKQIHKILESESMEVQTVPLEVRKELINARNEKEWTQKELAIKTGISEQDIKSIESGKALYNKNIIQKLKNVLGLNQKK